ncbi:hypothetical protein Tamer19_68340 [Cupriavidus sp. TA19]|nr:hypothetical protein Tamer19_68340 [Cupriavidus sp. TA19]
MASSFPTMCSFPSVADLARRMRIEPGTLLERFREAGVPKADAQAPVLNADVAALSALYRQLLGPRAIEIEAELDPPRAALVQNRVILVGNLGDDPETRYIPSGDPITNIRLATTDRYLDFALRVVSGYVTRYARGHLLLELLQGRVPAKMASVTRWVLRNGLRTLKGESDRVHRLLVLVSRAMSFAAQRLLSCRRADQEAAIHPAFAPPAVVI